MPELNFEGGSEQIYMDHICCTWKEEGKDVSVKGYISIVSKGEDVYLKCSKPEKNVLSIKLNKEFGSVRCYPLWLEVILKNGSRIIVKLKDSKLTELVAQTIITSAKETKFHAVLGENIQTLNKRSHESYRPPLVGSMINLHGLQTKNDKAFANCSNKMVSNNFESEPCANVLTTSTERSCHKIAYRSNQSENSPFLKDSEPTNQTSCCNVPRGFPNTGTNCYVNSVLQCLFSMPQFIRPLQVTKEDSSSKLFKELWKLLEWRTSGAETSRAFETISNIKTLVGFDLNKQEDAHEFLVSLFKHMGSDDKQDGGSSWCKKFRDCFEMTVEQVTKCLSCGAESVKSNTQNEILLGSVGKSNGLPVQSYLNQYFEPSRVECTCSICYHKWAELSLTIKKSPRILVLLLPRYDDVQVTLADVYLENFLSNAVKKSGKLKRRLLNDSNPRKRKKEEDSGSVLCSMDDNGRRHSWSESETESDVDLIGKTFDENPLPSAEENENRDPREFHVESVESPPSSDRYKFIGSVSHVGKDNTSGHYISDCFHLASQFPPKWFSFNDMIVVETNLKQITFLRSHRAYILFYMSESEFYSYLNGTS